MAAIDSLSVVNECLGILGELGVNALDEPHPMITQALAKLQTENAMVQADYWWFNVEAVTLSPQAGTGYLLVPPDTADADSLTQYPRLAVRGNRLYNLDEATDIFEDSLQVRLHRVVPFDDLPLVARAHVSARTVMAFSTDHDGDPTKLQAMAGKVRDTLTKLNAEHTRNARVNLLYSNSMITKLGYVVGGRRRWQTHGARSARFIGG